LVIFCGSLVCCEREAFKVDFGVLPVSALPGRSLARPALPDVSCELFTDGRTVVLCPTELLAVAFNKVAVRFIPMIDVETPD
jgi:hypothetical protein